MLNYNISLLKPVYNSEEQEELLYHDSDVTDRRDNRCKVKWSREEVCIVLFIKKNREIGLGPSMCEPLQEVKA